MIDGRSCCCAEIFLDLGLDILRGDRPVVDVVVDEFVFGVCATECDLNCKVDLVVVDPVGASHYRKLVTGDEAQVRRNFDQFAYSSYHNPYVSC